MKKVADRLHKIAVTGLMGLTVVGAITFSLQIYRYVVSPSKSKSQAKKTEAIEFTGESLANPT